MRDLLAALIAPLMRLTGYRFGKEHRQNETWQYRHINTVAANIKAGV